jgi:peptidoglycan/xylan/chitin deacetylase (PgdA/CDA1 family)
LRIARGWLIGFGGLAFWLHGASGIRAEHVAERPLLAMETAVRELARQDYRAAARQTRLALQSAPSDVLLSSLAGTLLLATGDRRGAQIAFQNAARAGDEALPHYGLSLAQLANGERAAALTSLDRAEQLGGDRASILIARRYAQWLSGAQVVLGGAALSANLTAAQQALEGVTAFQQRDWQRAAAALEAADAAIGGDPTRQPDGLRMTFDPQRPLVSAATLPEAERKFPLVPARRLPDANAEARTEADREHRDWILAALWAALTLRPDRCALACTLGTAYQTLGQWGAARKWFLRALAVQPDHAAARAQMQACGGLQPGSAAIWGGLPTERLIALTFDDGPKPGITEPLLDILIQYQAPATFFVIGRHVTAYPELTRRIAQAGMELANHSYTHPNLTKLSEAQIARELLRTQAAVQAVTGQVPRFVRPPGGNWSAKVADVSRQCGLTPCMWTVDVYGSEVIGAQEVANAVLSQVRPGSIILMHNGKANTLQALPVILRELRARGYTFVTVETLARRLFAAKAASQAAARIQGMAAGPRAE